MTKLNIGILFGNLDAQFSDGALKAIERARKKILQSNWKNVFKIENIKEEIKAITEGK